MAFSLAHNTIIYCTEYFLVFNSHYHLFVSLAELSFTLAQVTVACLAEVSFTLAQSQLLVWQNYPLP